MKKIIYVDMDGVISNFDKAAKVIYSPDKPLSCGAKVWIETQNKVKTI